MTANVSDYYLEVVPGILGILRVIHSAGASIILLRNFFAKIFVYEPSMVRFSPTFNIPIPSVLTVPYFIIFLASSGFWNKM